MTIRETSVYKKWFARLRDTVAKARILVWLRRASIGNYGETRDLGDGVLEFKFRFGPGCRIYFTERNGELIILLAGGDKSTQSSDIANAKELARNLRGEDMKTKTTAWNVADHLKTKESREAYLNAAFEDGDASVIAAALGDIAKAEGMSKVAKRTGLGRESLYKALSPDGNPALSTILKVVRAFELNLRVACL